MKVKFNFNGQSQELFASLMQLFNYQLNENSGIQEYTLHEGKAYLLHNRPVPTLGTHGDIWKITYDAHSFDAEVTEYQYEDPDGKVLDQKGFRLIGEQQRELGIELTLGLYRRDTGLPVLLEYELELWQPLADEILGHLSAKRGQVSLVERDDLSPREKEVAHLLATGKRQKEIAQELIIGTATVKTHCESISNKWGLNGTTAIAKLQQEAKTRGYEHCCNLTK